MVGTFVAQAFEVIERFGDGLEAEAVDGDIEFVLGGHFVTQSDTWKEIFWDAIDDADAEVDERGFDGDWFDHKAGVSGG